jgi:hypothetical protein
MAANFTDFVSGAVLTAAQLNGVLDNFSDVAIFNETQASGTQGGTNVAATWTKRTLNTTVVNNITGCTLTSSVISLPAGTYNAKVSSIARSGSAQSPDSFRHRLRNTTAGTNLGLTTSGYNGAANNSPLPAEIVTVFTLAATSNIEVQYYITQVIATVGLGQASTIASTDEIYTQIQITRIA